MRGVHLQRGARDVDQVEPQQGEVVVVDHIRTDSVDEFVMMAPNARRCAEDPRAEGLESPRGGGNRVTDDTAVPAILEIRPASLEGQGRGRIFDVDLVALGR